MSAPSATDICNEALGHIGQKPISTLLDTTLYAMTCARVYPKARRALLASYPWRFSVVEEDLAIVDEEIAGWDYVFEKPAGCLRVLQVTDTDGVEVDFESRGARIVCDEEEARIVYINDTEDTSLFEQGFIDVLEYMIAARLALPLTGKTEYVTAMNSLALQSMPSAQAGSAGQARKNTKKSIIGSRL